MASDCIITAGDVVYVPVFGHHFLILGSAKAVFDLLDKRSAITSDRHASPITEM